MAVHNELNLARVRWIAASGEMKMDFHLSAPVWLIAAETGPDTRPERHVADLTITGRELNRSQKLMFCIWLNPQGEMETQKQQHDAKLISTKEEEKLKMDKMALELELKWTETLRLTLHVFVFLLKNMFF